MGDRARAAASTTARIDRESDRLQILQTAFRFQLSREHAEHGDEKAYYFLSPDNGQDPPPALLGSLRKDDPGILPISVSNTNPRGRVIHKTLGGDGVIVVATVLWLIVFAPSPGVRRDFSRQACRERNNGPVRLLSCVPFIPAPERSRCTSGTL